MAVAGIRLRRRDDRIEAAQDACSPTRRLAAPCLIKGFFRAFGFSGLLVCTGLSSPLQAEPAAGAEAALARLQAAADGSSVERDTAGAVVRLALSNHQKHRPGNDKEVLGKPGITDASIDDLLALPQLRSLYLEKQALTAAGMERLAELPALEDLRLHYPGDRFIFRHHRIAPLDAGFARFIDRLPEGLQILELKHGFDVSGDGGVILAGLRPRPKLRKIELDVAFATPGCVEFLLGSPALENLQLHRTRLSDADLQRVFAALRSLRVAEVRPEGKVADPIRVRSLRGLAGHPSLERLYLSLDWGDLVWEEGLEALASIPTLKLVSLAQMKPSVARDNPVLLRFIEARPDVTVNLGRPADNVVRATPTNLGRDAETAWGITD